MNCPQLLLLAKARVRGAEIPAESPLVTVQSQVTVMEVAKVPARRWFSTTTY